jgi:hypothetical protein
MEKHKILTGNEVIRYTGVYADGWTFGTCSFELKTPDKPADLVIEGTVPMLNDQTFKTSLTARLNGQEAAKQTVMPGDFQVRLTCLPGPKSQKVELVFSATQMLPIPDVRQVGALLHKLSFAVPPTEIISSASGVSLGENWYPIETWNGETFRWVNNNAELNLDKPRLTMEIEPGPGLDSAPFDLLVLDKDNKVLTKTPVMGREFVTVSVLKLSEKIKLHIEGGGKATPNENRELNFRVFQIYTS